MGISKAQEKEFARMLFVNEKLSQKEIAQRVDVSERTLSKWAKDGKWEQMRKSMLVTKDHNLFLLYEQLQAINEDIQSREVKFGNLKEIQSIAMLTTSIQRLEVETSVGQTIEVAKGFIEFLRQIDVDKAKEATTYFDAYILTRMK
jgi:transcriptional regulator with XRE-family HTH domain